MICALLGIQAIECEIPRLQKKLAEVDQTIDELRPEVLKLQQEYDVEQAAAVATSTSSKKRISAD